MRERRVILATRSAGRQKRWSRSEPKAARPSRSRGPSDRERCTSDLMEEVVREENCQRALTAVIATRGQRGSTG